MERPVLVVHGAGEVAHVEAPPRIEPRAWVLGVIAVQAWIEEGRVRARLRRHVTGASGPILTPLSSGQAVEIHVSTDREIRISRSETTRPPPPVPELGGAAARLSLAIDGAPVAQAVLRREDLTRTPAPRAYGHVFCRWLRRGGHELGCDLTDFQSLPEGVKFERLVVPPLAVGQTASYTFVAA